jgi:hypothetical protein
MKLNELTINMTPKNPILCRMSEDPRRDMPTIINPSNLNNWVTPRLEVIKNSCIEISKIPVNDPVNRAGSIK